MSDVKKVLTLVACGCICLMVATSASADFTGVNSVNKGEPGSDIDVICNQGLGLTVCNLYAVFDDPLNRLISIGDSDMQVYQGAPVPGNEDVFYQNPLNFSGSTAPACANILPFPDVVCDSFVTIGWKCGPSQAPLDATSTEDDFSSDEFNINGHIVGGWFNASPPNGQGDAGNDPPNADLQVLFLQSSVLQGLSMSGFTTIFWQQFPQAPTIAEIGFPIECASKCIPGDECSDDDPCTENDECIDGNCIGIPIDCDDNEFCTDDSCEGGVCQHENNNLECDDGSPCTDFDVCSGGSCGGVAVDCSGDGDQCNDASCDEQGGQNNCDTLTPKPDSTPCEDGNVCTSEEGTPQTPDHCENGSCVGVPVDCSDGLVCNGLETCNPADGSCLPGTDLNCEDNECCTDDACVEPGGCENTPVDCPPGDACDPTQCPDIVCVEIPCDVNEDCNDNLICTDDVCTPAGCTNDPIPCGDDDACTEDGCNEVDGCTNTPIDCDDFDDCTIDSCNPDSDADIGCEYEDVVCDDDEDCTDDSCETVGGCLFEANDNNACTDNNLCTDDSCQGGECDSIVVVFCPDGEICDPVSGECVEAPSGALDIIPGKFPNRLRQHGLGFLKVALVSADADPDLGTEAFDACDVDIDSLVLVNANADPDLPPCDGFVAPRSNPRPMCKDRATPFTGELCDGWSRRKDGLPDLDMKFKLSELRTALCLDLLPAGTEVTLCLEGVTNDDPPRPIDVCDCVIVDRPGDGTPGPGGG